jgi:hypothetical protein
MTRSAPKDQPAPLAPDDDEDRTRELPAVAIPSHVRSGEETVPVMSSLERSLQHEMLRRQSEEDGDDDLPR